MKEAMVEPAPGRTPMMKPTSEPLMNAKRQSFMSCHVGSRLRQPFGTGSICVPSRISMLPSTSPRANTPIATTTKSTPSSISALPKVKREVEVKRSVPMLAIHSPTIIASRAFVIDLPASSTTMARPRLISAKYSGELNDRANFASGGAISISPTTPTVPAMKDAIAAMPSAAPARPFFAIS